MRFFYGVLRLLRLFCLVFVSLVRFVSCFVVVMLCPHALMKMSMLKDFYHFLPDDIGSIGALGSAVVV